MNRNSGGSEPGFLQSLQNPFLLLDQSLQNPFLQLDWGRRRPPLPPAEPQSGPVLESWRRLRQREAGESAGRRSPSPPQQIDVRPSDAGVRSPSIQEANGEDIEHLAVVSEPEDMEGMEFEVDSVAETGIEFHPNLHIVIEQLSRKRREEVNEMWSNYEKPRKKRRMEVDDMWSNLENENLDGATEHQEIEPVEFPGVDHGGDEIEAGPVATEEQLVEPEEFLGVDHGGDKIEATTEIRRSRRLAQRFEHAVRATASTTQAPTNLPGQQPMEHKEEIEEVVAANRAIPPRRASTRQRNPPARYGEWVDSGKLDFRKIR